MKKSVSILSLLLLVNFAKAGEMILQGNYQGKNLYIQNPVSDTGFCTTKVTVNGIEIPFEKINSSAYEIDLKSLNLKIGDTIRVVISHKDNCKPKVLITDYGKPKSTFELVKMEITAEGILKWTAKNEIGKLPYVIEQFRWNKWIKVGEVDSKGGTGENKYEFKMPLHSGEGQVRLKQVDYSSQPRYCKPLKFCVQIPEIRVEGCGGTDINFSAETMYEVYDDNGNIIKKGSGNKIDCSNLPKGAYYLNYDNKSMEFIIPKK